MISFGFILLIVGCNTEQRGETDTDKTYENSGKDTLSSVVYNPQDALWSYVYNQQNEEFEVKQVRSVNSDTLTGESLEKIINNNWPRIQIQFFGFSNDTVFILIPNSNVLTQQMGSAGAESFMVTTTYTFTELSGIDYVSFDFEEGDHGVPGVYHRGSWEKDKEH